MPNCKTLLNFIDSWRSGGVDVEEEVEAGGEKLSLVLQDDLLTRKNKIKSGDVLQVSK